MTTMPNPQPDLPVEGVYTDIELLMISEEPGGLFPENQNSNYGTLRKILSEPLQDAIDTLVMLLNELFISTANDFLGKWENELGLPDGSSLSVDARRARLSSRMTLGAFTRTRRKNIVESYIQATFGTPAQFSPGGLSLLGGIELHSESGDVTSMYTITEDVENFSYNVNIVPTVDPDIANLTRDLEWLTPAHISFTITRNP